MEVKSATGRQSPDQKRFEERVREAKGYYFLVRSVKEAEEAILSVLNDLERKEDE